jgi:adenine-specific DNA-methyltransferase
MPNNTREKRFFEALKNVFVGVPVEGESGYINLMRIKARYFEKVMEPRLREEIDKELQPFPHFREELFDKLYTFFRRYFTESGSIGFFFTPYHQSIYEQVYTNEQDVVLFWKTARLYYVKTDRLFRSMKVELDGFRFFFDVSQLEHKRANEKRELIYAFQERQQDGTIVFTVHYSEKGRQTKIDDIRRAIRDALGLTRYTDAVPSEETLQRAFRIFERQSEVDYFLCKDAKSFLREQFDLWMWQYLLGKPGEEPQTEWTEIRLAQLQALKRIAYRVIDYIAAFEDELVKIWNKPKFVLNSHYVITLDRIAHSLAGWRCWSGSGCTRIWRRKSKSGASWAWWTTNSRRSIFGSRIWWTESTCTPATVTCRLTPSTSPTWSCRLSPSLTTSTMRSMAGLSKVKTIRR